MDGARPVGVDWARQTDGSFRLDVTIPDNVTAEVHVPLAVGQEVRAGEVRRAAAGRDADEQVVDGGCLRCRLGELWVRRSRAMLEGQIASVSSFTSWPLRALSLNGRPDRVAGRVRRARRVVRSPNPPRVSACHRERRRAPERLDWPGTVIRDGADTILRVTADPDRPDDVAAIKHLFDAGLHL
jgi:hypothetical protein